jgi:hypothetical protein
MVTSDKSMAYQQNVTGRKISVVVLSYNRWPRVRFQIEAVRTAVDEGRVEASTMCKWVSQQTA